MKTATVQTLCWLLTYVGLLLASLGLFLHAAAPGLALACWVLGGVLVAVGAVLVFVRSRMQG